MIEDKICNIRLISSGFHQCLQWAQQLKVSVHVEHQSGRSRDQSGHRWCRHHLRLWLESSSGSSGYGQYSCWHLFSTSLLSVFVVALMFGLMGSILHSPFIRLVDLLKSTFLRSSIKPLLVWNVNSFSLDLLCLGSCPQDWSKETGARVPIHHGKYSWGKNRGACRNEAPLGLHCHSTR